MFVFEDPVFVTTNLLELQFFEEGGVQIFSLNKPIAIQFLQIVVRLAKVIFKMRYLHTLFYSLSKNIPLRFVVL